MTKEINFNFEFISKANDYGPNSSSCVFWTEISRQNKAIKCNSVYWRKQFHVTKIAKHVSRGSIRNIIEEVLRLLLIYSTCIKNFDQYKVQLWIKQLIRVVILGLKKSCFSLPVRSESLNPVRDLACELLNFHKAASITDAIKRDKETT